MKRITFFLLLMLQPLSVMALTPLSDSNLSEVIGQAGVNIACDLNLDINIGTLAWGDSDGIQGYPTSPWQTVGNGGYVGLTDVDINGLRIKPRETDTYNGYTMANCKSFTIDVATDNTTGHGGVENTTFVRFGLGSLEITMESMSFGVELGPTDDLGQMLGTVNLGALGMYINPVSYVDVYSHPGCGVNFGMNVLIDRVNIAYMSWGDTDGLPGGLTGAGGSPWMVDVGNSGGYFGLENFQIDQFTMTGTVAVDVATSAVGVYAYTGTPLEAPVTVVHISFPDAMNINVSSIAANVKLDSQADLNGLNAGLLGNISIKDLQFGIREASWVDIWAH